MEIVRQEHQEITNEVESALIEAEFNILTEVNEQSALSGSGLAILFHNWSQNN